MLPRACALPVVYGAGDPCTDYHPPDEVVEAPASGHDDHEEEHYTVSLRRTCVRCKRSYCPAGTFKEQPTARRVSSRGAVRELLVPYGATS